MRYAVILAGGSGTRLWPWSRAAKPKQLLPLVHGRSLLQLAYDRLDGLVAPERVLVCSGSTFQEAICRELSALPSAQYLGEPIGRDTAAALGFCAAVLAARDPEAVMAVSTADHIIEPVDVFRARMAEAFALAETHPNALVTFGVAPTVASTAYGYLELGEAVGAARKVALFREKPKAEAARDYLAAGPERYLWNSGMFVWRASTLLACLRTWQPEIFAGLEKIAAAYDTPNRDAVMAEVYPALKKISIDYAVMEPASHDGTIEVLALPLKLAWLDVGSWNAYAEICEHEDGNTVAAARHALLESRRVFVASDDSDHLVAVIGCEDLIVVHAGDATLVCRADKAEGVKQLHSLLSQRFGKTYM